MTVKGNVASQAEARRFYPAPGNRRAYLQQSCDNKIVVARPDLKFQIHRAIGNGVLVKTGFGFALSEAAGIVSFDFDRVEQKFEMDFVPILSQRVSQAGFQFDLESFTTRDSSGRGVIMLRLTVWRRKDSPSAVELAFLATRARQDKYSTYPNEDYIEFEPWSEAWKKQHSWKLDGSAIHDGFYIFAVARHSTGVSLRTGDGQGAVGMIAKLEPGRDAPETLEVLVPYECVSKPAGTDDKSFDFRAEQAFTLAQRDELLSLSYEVERERQRRQWLGQLGRVAQISVPDAGVQGIYRTLTLNNLQFLGSEQGVSTCRPGQGGYNDFAMVYAWEASHYLVQMVRQGYHAEVGRVMDYLLTMQRKTVGPEGDITDAEGCFRPHIHWMNETGSVLRIFAEYALTSGDCERLKRDAPALIKAVRWIQRQRNSTQIPLPDGTKPLHYGLLPKGRPHDWPIRGYFVFSDTYTWVGLDRLAEAFALAGLPDAGWLRVEADDYRQCILRAVEGSIKPHPVDPKLKWFPSDIYEDPAEAMKTTIFCGPNSLLGSGILDSGSEWIPMIEDCLRAAGCLGDHFAFRMRLMEDEGCRKRQLDAAGGHVDLYYVTFAEVPWHRVWLERGEFDKAWSTFNMTMAYSVSRDLHLAQERFCPQLPWLLPWQPNASANGRILSMILASLCLVQGKVCSLLKGVSDAWFAARAPLGVDGLWLNGSRLSFRLEPQADPAGWRFSYECNGPWVPEQFSLSLPCAEGGRMQKLIITEGRGVGGCRFSVAG